MGEPWDRFQEELDRIGESPQWLANQIGCSIQRVQNWTTRGVPDTAIREVADAFDETLDWVAGRAEPKWKIAAKTPNAPPPMDDDTLQFAGMYQSMPPGDRARLRMLLQVAQQPGATATPATLIPSTELLPDESVVAAPFKRKGRTKPRSSSATGKGIKEQKSAIAAAAAAKAAAKKKRKG